MTQQRNLPGDRQTLRNAPTLHIYYSVLLTTTIEWSQEDRVRPKLTTTVIRLYKSGAKNLKIIFFSTVDTLLTVQVVTGGTLPAVPVLVEFTCPPRGCS
jgi:hypothetical protein